MSEFSKAIAWWVERASNSDQDIDPDEMVGEFLEMEPDLVRRETEALVRRALAAAIKKAIKAVDQPQQDELFGLPRLVMVEPGVWRQRHRMTWQDFVAAREIREKNIRDATASLRAFDVQMTKFRPYLEHHPELTVDDALRQMRGES